MNAPHTTPLSQEDAFEQRLRSIVSDGIDQRLAPPRSAPIFDPGEHEPGEHERGRPQRRWVVALVAAACALILAAGAIVATTVLRPAQTLPAGPAPTPTFTDLGGARIALPIGWVAVPGPSPFDNTGWCLTPASQRSSAGTDDCPINLWTAGKSGEVSAEDFGGYPNNGVPCDGRVDDGTLRTNRTAVRTFGDRPAQWHRWVWTCAQGKDVSFEQYVVTTKPSWVLFSTQASDPAIEGQLTSIARNSQLPG